MSQRSPSRLTVNSPSDSQPVEMEGVQKRGERRAAVVAAFEAADEVAVRRVGWWDVWDAAATWWKPRQTCTATEFVPYAKLLSDEDPAEVLEALRQLAGDWRPTPAQVRGFLHRKPEESAVNVARSRDRAKTAEALRAVAAAVAAGERVCSCDFRPSTWTIDDLGVLRCPVDRGLEQGQVYAAEDLDSTAAAA